MIYFSEYEKTNNFFMISAQYCKNSILNYPLLQDFFSSHNAFLSIFQFSITPSSSTKYNNYPQFPFQMFEIEQLKCQCPIIPQIKALCRGLFKFNTR